MTRLSAVLVAVAFLLLAAPAGAAVSTNQSGWLWGSPEPQGYTLNALELQGSTGYAAGDFGTLLRTNDGGTGWGTVRTGQSLNFREIDVIDADSVVLASDCAARRTDDGGKTFRRLPFISNERSCARGVRAVSFPTGDIGYLLLGDGAVLRTDDGGRSFSSKPVPGGGGFISALMFRNETDGLAATTGGDIFRTTNGGNSWTREFDGGGELNGVLFTAGQAVAVGNGGAFLVSGDGGDTWTNPITSGGDPTGNEDFVDVRCASPTVCLVVTRFGGLFRTADGGQTFANTRITNVLAADFASASRAVVVGSSGQTQISDDGGASFTRLGNALPGEFGPARVRATSASVAHAAGPSGVLMRTVDGGETWVNIGVPTGYVVQDFWFPTAELGYAIDQGGGLFRTDNAGASWSILDPGENIFAHGVFAPDASTVYLIGGTRGAQRSTDGGETFKPHTDRVIRNQTLEGADQAGSSVVFYGPRVIALSKNDGKTFRKVVRPTSGAEIVHVDFVSAEVGYAIETDGRVYFTRNGGKSWTERIATGYSSGAQLAFGNSRNGWIRLGDARPNVLRTTDGGRSWTPQILGREPITGLAAAGSQTGFATHFAGILFTRDGGGAGAAATLRLSTPDRKVPRGEKIKIRGTLSPAEGGEDVEVRGRRLTGRAWREIDVTPNKSGRFVIERRIRRPMVFVAQWEGDPSSDGDGSRPLIVRTG